MRTVGEEDGRLVRRSRTHEGRTGMERALQARRTRPWAMPAAVLQAAIAALGTPREDKRAMAGHLGRVGSGQGKRSKKNTRA